MVFLPKTLQRDYCGMAWRALVYCCLEKIFSAESLATPGEEHVQQPGVAHSELLMLQVVKEPRTSSHPYFPTLSEHEADGLSQYSCALTAFSICSSVQMFYWKAHNCFISLADFIWSSVVYKVCKINFLKVRFCLKLLGFLYTVGGGIWQLLISQVVPLNELRGL